MRYVGLELILKMHEKLALDKYPLQSGADGESWGFGPKERTKLKENYCLNTRQESFDLDDFKRMAVDEADKGFSLIFSMLNGPKLHVWVPYLESGKLIFRSRSWNDPSILTENHLDIDHWYAESRRMVKNYEIDCLLHSPI